jgi:hypothetical protein
MNTWQFIIYVLIPSGLIGALTGGLVNHFSNKKLDVHRRMMEIRKDLYTKVNNQLAFFFDTVSEKESDEAREDLLKYFREIQIWGSDEVVRSFKKLMDLMAIKESPVEKRNLCYKNFVIAMRKDILKKTALTAEEIDIRGIIKK